MYVESRYKRESGRGNSNNMKVMAAHQKSTETRLRAYTGASSLHIRCDKDAKAMGCYLIVALIVVGRVLDERIAFSGKGVVFHYRRLGAAIGWSLVRIDQEEIPDEPGD